MKTKDLGFHIQGVESPFLTLKQKIISEAKTLKIEDRMQGVRYLCNIPYNNATYHCVEAAFSVIMDESIDVYKRFYFFDNRDKHFRLDDHVVNFCHPGFFKYGLKVGPVKVPYELMRLSAKYILHNYDNNTPIRQTVLDWCLDTIENEAEDVYTKVETLKVLMEKGERDEVAYAKDQLYELGIDEKEGLILSDHEKLAYDLLRALRTKHTVKAEDTLSGLFQSIVNMVVKEKHSDEKLIEAVDAFFNDYVSGDARLEGITVHEICVLASKEIDALRKQSSYESDECLRRLVYQIERGYGGDTLMYLLTVFEGFVAPREFQLQPSLIERLRHDVFAALNASLLGLNDGLRENVEASRASEDKSACREFLMYFDDEKESLWKQYNQPNNKIDRKQFDDMYDKITGEWMKN